MRFLVLSKTLHDARAIEAVWQCVNFRHYLGLLEAVLNGRAIYGSSLAAALLRRLRCVSLIVKLSKQGDAPLSEPPNSSAC
jgi:hypothetical protein